MGDMFAHATRLGNNRVQLVTANGAGSTFQNHPGPPAAKNAQAARKGLFGAFHIRPLERDVSGHDTLRQGGRVAWTPPLRL